MSYSQLKEYLAVLMENGLLEHLPIENLYRTTEKGMMFMKAYENMEIITGPLQAPEAK